MRTRSGNMVGGSGMGARILAVAAVAALLFLLLGLGAHASASNFSGTDSSGPILPVETGLPVYLSPKDTVSDPFVTIEADMERFAALNAAVDIIGTRDDGAPVQMNDVYCAITRGAPGSRDSIQCPVFLSEGFYQADVKVWDQSGVKSSASGSFAVSVPVKFVAPLTSSVNANFTLRAEIPRYAATLAGLDVNGVRADGVQVGVNDIYCAISRGAPGYPDTISCPVALSDGDYQAALKIWDQNGYLQTEVDTFTVSSPITDLSPAGTLASSAFDIRANMEPSVARRAGAGITGVLHGGGDFKAYIYCGITRGMAGQNDTISCPVSLSDGDYQVTLRVWDANGFMRTAASTLTVSMRPALSVQAGGSFWQSYADYQARRLTALMIVSNTGALDATAVRITGSSNSNGVTPGSTEPIECGDLGAGAQAQVWVTFSVPAGVSSFSSRLKATAVNSKGTVYNYPA